MKPTTSLSIIAKKELFSYLNSAVAYVVLVPFLIISSFLFFRSALLLNDANLRPFVELLPWFLMIIAPALAMKSFSEEKRKDTTELLFAHPISEWTVVAGKFLGIFLFYGLMLAATLPLPLTLAIFSKPDLGVVIGQYIGMLALGGVFLAIGVAASALIGSVVGSFLAATAINFFIILLGMNFIVLLFPGFIGRIIYELAILPHATSISRGVLDLRDLLYFFTLILIALTVAVIKLSERKVSELPKEKQKLWSVMALIIGVGLAGNVLMYEFPLRIDLTASHQYSLSQGTKKLLADLPDRVTVTLYSSQNLPGSMQLTLRDTTDWLKDFKNYGKKIVLRTINTDASQQNKQDASTHGIREVQFNQIGSNSYQVQTGFLGLEVRYGDKTDVIDFINDSSNLEYQLSRMILKLTHNQPQKIGLISATSQVTIDQFNTQLGKDYTISSINNTSKLDTALGMTGVVVVDDGTTNNATPAAILKEYLHNGGNAAVFVDGVAVSGQTLQAKTSISSILDVLKDYGITIKPSLAFDWSLNEPVQLGQGAVSYILPYPFWIRALTQPSVLPGSTTINNVLLGWASVIESKPKDGWTIKPLLKTSKSGGMQEGTYTVNPNDLKSLPKPTGEQTVGVLAEKDQQRIVVIGDADLISDNFLTNSQENQNFISNVVDWVAADPILNQIPRRVSSRNVFLFTSSSQATIVQYTNIIAPALICAGFGAWWIWRRRQLTKRVWQGDLYAK